MPPTLALPHQMMLIQLDDHRGTSHVDGTWAQYLLAGALAAELQLAGRLVVTGADCFAIGQGDPLPGVLGEAEIKLGEVERSMQATVEALVGFWGIEELKQSLIDELVKMGALKRKTDRFLFVPWRWRYPTDDPEVERSLLQALKHHVDNAKAKDPPGRADLLLSLLRAADLLEVVWTPSALERRRGKINERTKRAPIGRIVKTCVENANLALAVGISTAT